MNLLRKVLADPSQPYEWLAILKVFWQLSSRSLTAEEMRLLREASEFHGDVNLTHCYDGPHRCPPDQMIRELSHNILKKDCVKKVADMVREDIVEPLKKLAENQND
jgi:hypothetical protein